MNSKLSLLLGEVINQVSITEKKWYIHADEKNIFLTLINVLSCAFLVLSFCNKEMSVVVLEIDANTMSLMTGLAC